MTPEPSMGEAGLVSRSPAVDGLLEASRAAQALGDWPSATAMAEAALTLAPDDAEVQALLAAARAGAVPQASRSGSRRRVTVMFCDLVGSTGLASTLDPEDTREILGTYHQACGDIVRRYDGHVAHLMGDGLLVYFGYPRAHEDDGLRSVMAALEMAETVPLLRSPSSGAPLGLRVRVGIHTGLAVISDMGAGDWSRPGDIAGKTPNLAARVQTAAEPDTILLSADTLRLVRGKIAVEALGPHSLKGIEEPVELYRALSVIRATDDSVDAIAIGRLTEVDELERSWERARDSNTYVVITGEPGIGKSHLVHHVRHVVNASGGQTVTLRCSALDAHTPLAPVVSLLTARLDDAADPQERLELLAGMAEAAGIVDDEPLYLLATLTGVPWPADRVVPDLQPEQARERTLLILLAWLDGLAAERPLLVVVEDLQWADASTVDLLGRFVTQPRPHPSMVVVTTRLAAASAPGTPTSVLELTALDATSCDELIDTLTGGRFDPATRAMIAERGDGVPLYVRELARMLEPDEHGDAAAIEGSVVSIPPTLNDLLLARLDAFPLERSLVEALAVLGRPTPVPVLSALLDLPAIEVQRQLDVLEQAGIVRYLATPPEYDFRHALLRDEAYEVQLIAQRRDLHARAAAVLEAAFAANNDDQPHVLAHHHEVAGSLATAATHWMRAGSRQAGFAAHAEAIGSFERVIGLLDRIGSGDDASRRLEIEARSGLAASLLASRGYTAAEVADAYAKVRELSSARDSRAQVASLYGLWAYYHVTGDAVASLEAAEAMVDSATQSADRLAEQASQAVLGYQLVRLGRPVDAIGLLEAGRGWSSPEPFFPHHPGIGAAANLAMAQWLLGNFADARDTIDAAVTAAEALTGPTAHFTRAYTHAFAAELFQVSGYPGLAAQHAGRTAQVSAEFGFTSWLGAGMTNLKVSEALLGDPDEAIPVIEFCLDAWRGAGAASSLTQFGLGLALADRRAGRTAAALAVVDAAIRDAAASDERFVEPELHRVRGELLAELDPSDPEATAELELAVGLAMAQGARALQLRALTSLERHLHATDAARSVAAQLESLLAALDPSGADAEPVLVEARSQMVGETA